MERIAAPTIIFELHDDLLRLLAAPFASTSFENIASQLKVTTKDPADGSGTVAGVADTLAHIEVDIAKTKEELDAQSAVSMAVPERLKGCEEGKLKDCEEVVTDFVDGFFKQLRGSFPKVWPPIAGKTEEEAHDSIKHMVIERFMATIKPLGANRALAEGTRALLLQRCEIGMLAWKDFVARNNEGRKEEGYQAKRAKVKSVTQR